MGHGSPKPAAAGQTKAESVDPDLPHAIAHDLRNMLQFAASAVRITRRGLAGDMDPGLSITLARALDAIDRAGLLAHRLVRQSASRRDLERVVVPEVVLSLSQMLRHALEPGVRLDTTVSEPVPALFCDPLQLENAIINLVLNARDAMPGGGRLIIMARACSAQDHSPRCVALSVIDNGCGMTPDVAARALIPFFTTKADRGTGIGLSSARGFAEKLGGSVELRSSPGDGTCVTLHLPGSSQEEVS